MVERLLNLRIFHWNRKVFITLLWCASAYRGRSERKHFQWASKWRTLHAQSSIRRVQVSNYAGLYVPTQTRFVQQNFFFVLHQNEKYIFRCHSRLKWCTLSQRIENDSLVRSFAVPAKPSTVTGIYAYFHWALYWEFDVFGIDWQSVCASTPAKLLDMHRQH